MATPPPPTITDIYYQSPVTPTPRDHPGNQGGVKISCSNSTGYVLVGRIMQGNDMIVVNCSLESAADLYLLLPYPLQEDQSYYAQAQLISLNGGGYDPQTIIANAVWTNIPCIPVIASMLHLTNAAVEITGTTGSQTLLLTLNWSNENPVTAYTQVFIPAAGLPWQSPTFVSCYNKSTTLSFEYPATATYLAVLRALIPLSTPATWPPAALPTLIPYSAGSGVSYILPTQSPAITSVSYDGQYVTVAWNALTLPQGAEPASYELLLTCTNNNVATTVVFPATSTGAIVPLLMPGSAETYTVSARVNYGVIKGPASPNPVPVVTGSVNDIMQTLEVSTGTAGLTWIDASRFNSVEFTGYTERFNLTFSGGSTPANATSTQTSYNLPATLITNAENTVKISVSFTNATIGVITTGPLSQPSTFGFDPSFFFNSVNQANLAPFIYPAPAIGNVNTLLPSTIAVYLPAGNYSKSGTTFAAPVQYPTASPVFRLAANTNDNSAQYPFALTINSPAWDTNIIRASLQANYIGFLEAAETANMSAWGISVLQEAIARYMPQTFAETLYYHYGLNHVTNDGPPQIMGGYADLRPGMVLRIIPSDYMVVPGPDRGSTSFSYLDGYTNKAPLDYDVNSYLNSSTGWTLGFDAFITQLVNSGILSVAAPPIVQTPNVGGIAEGADLYFLQQPFYRLFFPTDLMTPTGPGATTPLQQFNLAAASSFGDLQNTSNGTTNNTNVYFRGRSVIKLCIRISINGKEEIVPIGTTVANILERMGRVPPKVGVTLAGISLERAMGQSNFFGNALCNAKHFYKVKFDAQPLIQYTNGQSILDIPLLHGDILNL